MTILESDYMFFEAYRFERKLYYSRFILNSEAADFWGMYNMGGEL